jgi:hypothetical protein
MLLCAYRSCSLSASLHAARHLLEKIERGGEPTNRFRRFTLSTVILLERTRVGIVVAHLDPARLS